MPDQDIIAAIPNRTIMAEYHRRFPGDAHLDITNVPDEDLIRELLARAEMAFLVGGFRCNDGDVQIRFRAHGDRNVVAGILTSASDMVRWQSRESWGDAEKWT